ncbi:MAG: hypothetical protein IID32_04775 [Planctomycetes bacterium]|nr:hypothetical protein [Planctomycetota bacterium]
MELRRVGGARIQGRAYEKKTGRVAATNGMEFPRTATESRLVCRVTACFLNVEQTGQVEWSWTCVW